MGEIMPIDGHLEWAAVIDRHKVLFGIKNRDMQSLHHKFNNLARMTPPTGDANIPPLDVQHAIKIKMDSGRVTFHDLGTDVCDGGDGGGGLDGDLELDEDCVEAGDEAVAAGANLVNEFGINEEQLCNDLCHTPVDGINIHHTWTELNNQQQGVMQQQVFHAFVRNNNLPPALNQHLALPQVPHQQQPLAPYQALLAAGGVACPPFVSNQSAGKLMAEDYNQQMLFTWLKRQEMEEQEREWRCIEREECLAELEVQRLERERRLEGKKWERDCERDEERKEWAEERKAQHDMMNMFMMAFVGRTMSGEESPAKKKRKKKSDDSDSN
jgi:hypothetical protein